METVLKHIVFFQEVDEYDFSMFGHGGVNITGFKLVSNTNPVYIKYKEKWEVKRNGEDTPPPLTVRYSKSKSKISIHFIWCRNQKIYTLV